MKIPVLLLAAGGSSRMGSPKQLLTWGNKTVIEHATDIVLSSKADRCILVLGAGERKIRSVLGERQVEIVVNKAWKEGLGSSIGTGIKYLLSGSQPPDAVLIMLADQPFLDSEFLNRLMNHFKAGDGEIVCTDYGRKKGTPAIFHRQYFSSLANLGGEEGAGSLIATHSASVFSLEGGKRTVDLDTPEDFQNLKQHQSNSNV